MLVLFSHFQRLTAIFGDSLRIFGRSVGNISEGMGYYGVCIFFVVSGFLITNGALRRYGVLSRINFAGFWRLRLARILPMVVVCVYALVLFHGLGIPRFVLTSAALVEKVVASIFAFQFNAVINSDPSFGVWNPMWSLSVEEMFYLVFPLACLAINGRAAALWLGLALIALASYLRLSSAAGYYSTLGCMDLLTFGCLLATFQPGRLRDRWAPWAARVAGVGALLLGAALSAFAILKWPPLSQQDYRGPLLCGLGTVLMLAGSQLVTLPRRGFWIVLPVAALGVISYELYLIHLPLATVVRTAFGWDGWSLVVLAILLAVLTHELFSEPMNRALRRGTTFRRAGALIAGPLVAVTAVGLLLHRRSLPVHVALKIEQLAPMAAGSSEPVAYVGHSHSADLVFLRHTPNGKVQFGVDHWGSSQLVLGPELPPAAVLQQPITIAFATSGVTVRSPGGVWVDSHEPRASSSHVVHVGINDIEFSTAAPLASSHFSAIPRE